MLTSSTSINKSLFAVALTVFALAFTACSRGKNTPPASEWNKDSMLKVKCKSPKAFDVDKEIETLLKSNIADESAAALYVVRTIPIKHTSTSEADRGNDEYHKEPFIGGLPNDVAIADYYNSPMLISVSKPSCSDLARSYEGPGVESGFSGKMTAVSNKSITISSTDDQGVEKTVTIEKVAADPKTEKKEAGKDRLRQEMGIGYFNITVKTTANKITRTVVYQQRVTLKKDELLDIDASIIGDALAVIGTSPRAMGLNLDPTITANSIKTPATLQDVQVKLSEQLAKKPGVKWKYSELLALKAAFTSDLKAANIRRAATPAADDAAAASSAEPIQRVVIVGQKPATAKTQPNITYEMLNGPVTSPSPAPAPAAVPAGSAANPVVLQRVEITGKRMTSEEKAAYDKANPIKESDLAFPAVEPEDYH